METEVKELAKLKFKKSRSYQRFYCRICKKIKFDYPYQTENLISVCEDCFKKVTKC